MTMTSHSMYDPKSRIGRLTQVLSAPTLEDARVLMAAIGFSIAFSKKHGPWELAVLELRAAGTISVDECLHWLEHFAADIPTSACETDPGLVSLGEQEDVLRRLHGKTEDESWPDPPAEYTVLNDLYLRRMDEMMVEHWRTIGAQDAADLLERSPDEFHAAARRGRLEYQGRWEGRSERNPGKPSQGAERLYPFC